MGVNQTAPHKMTFLSKEALLFVFVSILSWQICWLQNALYFWSTTNPPQQTPHTSNQHKGQGWNERLPGTKFQDSFGDGTPPILHHKNFTKTSQKRRVRTPLQPGCTAFVSESARDGCRNNASYVYCILYMQYWYYICGYIYIYVYMCINIYT